MQSSRLIRNLLAGGTCLLAWASLPAQDVTRWGVLPGVQVAGQLPNKVEYFFQLGSETYWLESTEGQTEGDFWVRHLDLSAGADTDLGTDWNVAASLLLRRRSPFEGTPGWELRPWAQLTHVARFGKYRLRNRLRAEQRFVQSRRGDDWRADLRLRYRLSADFPLQGERLDDGEFYLNSSTELLLTPTRPDWWFYRNPRGYVGLGYQLDGKNKLEGGLEFRKQNGAADGSDERIMFWRLNWVVNL